MPVYSKKKFAQLCGKQPAHISTNIARGKIILSGDLIDTDIPENFEAMNKWRIQESLDPIEPDHGSEPAMIQTSIDSKPSNESTGPTPSKTELSALNLEKTRIEIIYKTEKAAETQLKNAKLRGELIPTNIVIDMFAMLGHQFQTQYEYGAAELVAEIMHKLSVSPEMRGEIRKKLTETINKSHRTAIEESKIAVRNLISAVSGAEMEMDDVDDDDND